MQQKKLWGYFFFVNKTSVDTCAWAKRRKMSIHDCSQILMRRTLCQIVKKKSYIVNWNDVSMLGYHENRPHDKGWIYIATISHVFSYSYHLTMCGRYGKLLLFGMAQTNSNL